MTLILMRHAEAAHASTDVSRPLSSRGRYEARKAARRIESRGIAPDLILVSTAERTQETGNIIRDTISPQTPVHADGSLYTGGDIDYLSCVSRVRETYDTVLLIGHNPTISAVATMFAGYTISFAPSEAVYCRPVIDTWADLALSGTDRMEVLRL